MIPKFNNTENIAHTSKETGATIWESRSIAVCIRYRVGVRDNEGNINVYNLLLLRGDKVTHTGKWCFPCGYLDRDETCRQAAVRELFEEAGIYIQDSTNLVGYEIKDDPKSFSQNITIHYDIYELMSENIFAMLKAHITKHVEEHRDEGEVTSFCFVDENAVKDSHSPFSNPKCYSFNHRGRVYFETGIIDPELII